MTPPTTQVRGREFLRSLRLRLFAAVLAIAVAPLLFIVIWGRIEYDIEGALRGNTLHAAEATVALLRETKSDEDLARDLDTLAAQHVVHVRVLDGSGNAVAASNRDYTRDWVHQLGTIIFGGDGGLTVSMFDQSLGDIPRRPESVAATEAAPQVGCRPSEGSKILVCHAVALGKTSNGAPRLVYVQESTGRAARRFYDLRYQVARLSLLTIPLALLIGLYLSRSVLNPIERLRRSALAQVAEAEPRASLDVPEARDEIGDLARAFQTLLGKLDDKRGSHERFLVDLVHELKSPLAAILVVGEHLEQDPDRRTTRLASILKVSTDRLQQLVSDVLELARAEAGMRGEQRERVDLAVLTRAAMDATRLKFPKVALELATDGPLEIEAIPVRLESVVHNLLDNGAHFAEVGPRPARVDVRLEGHADHVELIVADSGRGLAEDELPSVFQRFYTRRDGGTGLGLPLAQAIVSAHGGQISASNGSSCGAVFTVWLPRKPPPEA